MHKHNGCFKDLEATALILTWSHIMCGVCGAIYGSQELASFYFYGSGNLQHIVPHAPPVERDDN